MIHAVQAEGRSHQGLINGSTTTATTLATSRTRRSRRLAILGVPRQEAAMLLRACGVRLSPISPAVRSTIASRSSWP